MHTLEIALVDPPQPLLPGTAQRLGVEVRNHGPEVEEVRLEPTGPLAPWLVLSEPSVRIWPGETARVELTVDLPEEPRPPAGPTRLGVLGRTGDGVQGVEEVEAWVGRHVAVELPAPHPHALETARRARVDLTPVNHSNVPVRVEVGTTDREGRLRQDRPRGPLTLQPGQWAGVGLLLACRKVTWRGKPVPIDYTVTVTAHPAPVPGQEQEPRPVEPLERTTGGVLVQAPALRLWWLAVWLLLLVLTVTSSEGWGWLWGPLTILATLLLVGVVLYRLLVVRHAPARSRDAPESGR